MAYGVVRTDNMYGTDVRAGLVSLKYFVSTTATAIENGNVVTLNGLISGEREVFKAVAPAANTPLNEVVLVASPEVMYDEHKHNLDEFVNEAGAIARGYRLHKGDIFSVTADALSAASDITVGDIVELQAGTKLKVVGSATASTTTVGKVIAIDNVGRYTYYVILVG